MVSHLRRSFPATVDAATIKRLGIAPNNESYLINILRFIGVIDSEGKRTAGAAQAFSIHEDDKFQEAFSKLVKNAYKQLFEDHGDGAWDLDSNALITFFRQTDESSGIVGARQATTFRALSALGGHGETPTVRASGATKPGKEKSAAKTSRPPVQQKTPPTVALPSTSNQLGLTVRVEVNLPADAAQETYDRIFQSIRRNLIDGK